MVGEHTAQKNIAEWVLENKQERAPRFDILSVNREKL